MDVREIADSGSELVHESGTLPGWVAGAAYAIGGWIVSTELAYHTGALDYQGQTQAAAAFASRTDTQTWDGEVRVMRMLDQAGRHAVGLSLSHRRWSRGIRGQGRISGLDEVYANWLGSVDVTVALLRSDAASVDLDLRLGRSFDSRVDVDFAGRFDDTTLHLGERWTARVSAPARFATGLASGVVVEPRFESWGFGRSQTEPLLRNGQPVGAVYQPRIKAYNVDLRVYWALAF